MSKAKQQAYEAKINDNVSIFGKPYDGHILYRIKNGAAVTQILLSVEAVACMLNIMNSIEEDKKPKLCADCIHSFENPFDQQFCEIRDEREGEVYKACKEFEPRKDRKASK